MTNNYENISFGKLTGGKTIKNEIKKEKMFTQTQKVEEKPKPFEIEVKSWVEDK